MPIILKYIQTCTHNCSTWLYKAGYIQVSIEKMITYFDMLGLEQGVKCTVKHANNLKLYTNMSAQLLYLHVLYGYI